MYVLWDSGLLGLGLGLGLGVGGAQPLTEGAEDEVVGELLIPVSRLPQNEPVEQWYGLEPPAGSGKTFTKAALRLRFLFTTTASPDSAAAASAAAAASGSAAASPSSTFAASAATAAAFAGIASGSALAGDGASATGELTGGGGGGERWGDGSVGGSDAGGVGDSGGRASPGLGGTAADEGFRDRAWATGGSGTEGGDARKRSFTDGSGGGGGGVRGDADEFAVNPHLDPFGQDDDGDDGGRSGAGGTRPGELTLLRSEQLQLGNWAGTSSGTIHAVSWRGRGERGGEGGEEGGSRGGEGEVVLIVWCFLENNVASSSLECEVGGHSNGGECHTLRLCCSRARSTSVQQQ